MADASVTTVEPVSSDSRPTNITERYRTRTPISKREWEEYRRNLPDGHTRATAFFTPHPIVLVRGEGAIVIDADGNRYFDLLNNYTSLVHGNAHPLLAEAARSVIEGGTVFPSPHRLQAEHAATLCERLSNAEMVRYTNSGTEASMMAVRVARAATGRDLVAKARCGYHGSWDGLWVSAKEPGTQPYDLIQPGVPRAVHDLVRVFEFNDSADLTSVCQAAGSDLAAIIIEPLLGSGGAVPATPEFLARARQLADETGALLIIDEVQTFRLSTGGLQQRLGCRPDLTTLGKLIGGGFPIGAIAGPRDLLELFRQDSPHHLEHSGTYNGNLVSMAAGLKAVEMLTEDAIDGINAAGNALADTLATALVDCGLAGCVTGYGSMFNAHLGANATSVKTASDVLGEDARLMAMLHLAFLNEGIFTSPRGFLNCSTVLTDRDLQGVAKALARAVEAVAAEADTL